MSKNFIRTHHHVLVATQATLALLLLTLTTLRIGNFASADIFKGDESSSAPSLSNDVVDGGGTSSGGGSDPGLAIFRAPKDNTQDQWTWSQDGGWKLHQVEQTYENGWAWSWKDGQWIWAPTNTDAPGAVKAVASSVMSSNASSVVDDTKAGCFDNSAMWVTDRTLCSTDQDAMSEKAAEALDASGSTLAVPAEIADALKAKAPLTPEQETEVKAALVDRFEGADAVSESQTKLDQAASDVVSKLSILKSSDALTDTERQYFVSKIVEAQALLTQQGVVDSMQGADASAAKLAGLISDVQSYVKTHAIQLNVDNAPTASSLFASAQRILNALPAAFDSLEAAGYSTDNLRSMQTQTKAFADAVSVNCANQHQDCGRVSDVVTQIETIVSTLSQMVEASSDPVLKTQVQENFDQALRQ